MDNSSFATGYADSDPPSALYSGIWLAVISIFGIPLNIFIAVATVRVRDIRAIGSNAFIGSLALSDTLLTLCFGLHLVYALSSSEKLCKVLGFGVGTFAMIGFCVPSFLAMNRYAIVCRQQDKLARYMFKIFTRKGIYSTIVLLWVLVIVYQTPFALLDTLGMHVIGLCSTTNMYPHTSFIRIYYYCGSLFIVPIFNGPLLICYRKVSLWVKTMSGKLSLSVETKRTLLETKSVLRLTKWVTIFPIICTSPLLIVAIVAEFNANLISIGIARLITFAYPLIPLFNAITTLKFARPYRFALKEVCEKSTVTSTLFSWIIEGKLRYKVATVSNTNTFMINSRA